MKVDFFSRIKALDAYPKMEDEFKVKTVAGATFSLVAIAFMLLLFCSELSIYWTTDTRDHLVVDTLRQAKLRINFNVTFPALPCAILSLDAMDVAGEHQLDIINNINKARLHADGSHVGITEVDAGLTKEEKEREADLLAGVNKNKDKGGAFCGSCYGAEMDVTECCNTCEDVRVAYKRRAWRITDEEKEFSQCSVEGLVNRMRLQSGEGCEVYGFLEVSKVAGNFHFAPGKSFSHANLHIHDLMSIGGSQPAFNISHTVNRLSFGEDFPNRVNPLDGQKNGFDDNAQAGMYQYFIKIVPTAYNYLNGNTLHTNQYSVTDHFRPIASAGHAHGRNLPGVFFFYDLSPIMVDITESRPSLAHFLTGLCAIIGGVFTVCGIIDGFIYHSIRTIFSKFRSGKNI
eukprot:gnl/Hemi2/12403_TR4235_c0_g1_i1.p1 gnl/Hemi2/12403_TR4235_c0_g1~~gnl/Hemi2/12403_TR4235_c0_g1_i1.p1  ORF type:complete len:401 (+),score=170.66 gnl/Hemi2/12403_TR4235_c0_g1_i1:81-1283(+)